LEHLSLITPQFLSILITDSMPQVIELTASFHTPNHLFISVIIQMSLFMFNNE